MTTYLDKNYGVSRQIDGREAYLRESQVQAQFVKEGPPPPKQKQRPVCHTASGVKFASFDDGMAHCDETGEKLYAIGGGRVPIYYGRKRQRPDQLAADLGITEREAMAMIQRDTRPQRKY